MAQTSKSILDALSFIEDNLKDFNLSLESVAYQIGYSPNHFSELFHLIVGQTYQTYVVGRRLTRCAEELIESNMRIIDIASEWGFSSQSTFTRSFRNLFGVTPAQYRRDGAHIFTESPCLLQKRASIPLMALEPRIEVVDSFELIGMQFTWSFSSGYNIMDWWNECLPYLRGVFQRDSAHYFGLCSSSNMMSNADSGGELSYFAGVVAPSSPQQLPPPLSSTKVKGGKYAVFEVEGGYADLMDTCRYIWGTWVPRNKYVSLDFDNFDVYPPEAVLEGDWSAPMEIWYPIVDER